MRTAKFDRQISIVIDSSTHERLTRLLEQRTPQEGDPEPTFSAVTRAALLRGIRELEGDKARASTVGASAA